MLVSVFIINPSPLFISPWSQIWVAERTCNGSPRINSVQIALLNTVEIPLFVVKPSNEKCLTSSPIHIETYSRELSLGTRIRRSHFEPSRSKTNQAISVLVVEWIRMHMHRSNMKSKNIERLPSLPMIVCSSATPIT